MSLVGHGCVFFDLDNTLVDREGTLVAFAEVFYDHFSHLFDSTDYEEVFNSIRNADQGGYRPKDEFFTELTRILPWEPSPSAEEISDFWRTRFPKCAKPIPGVGTTLKGLKGLGLKVGIITNGSEFGQNLKIDVLGIRDQMSCVIVSEAIGVKKPEARIFEVGLSEVGVSAKEAWFVGDHPVNDVLGAAAVRMTPIWKCGYHTWPSEQPEPMHQIDSLDEVLEIVTI